MIAKDNLEMILEHNKTHLPKIKKAMDRIYSLGDPLAHVKPLDFIKTYLYEHANVLQFPIQHADYGGLVYYYNGDYYVHINTVQKTNIKFAAFAAGVSSVPGFSYS
ncbi:hypothetical protein [Geobacillus thermoleovorans]|uniref:hypothetical protein n=1 Tax=Geobacillus thermoleovorans TaxID=33941 RepID=UPI003DA40A5C